MIAEQNFAPGNAGIIFWTDIIVPLIGLIFLWLQYGYEKEGHPQHLIQICGAPSVPILKFHESAPH
jgi:hypothetical protein